MTKRLLLALVATALLAGCGGDGRTVVAVTARPIDGSEPSPEPSETPTETPSPSESPSEDPSPTEEPSRPPTDTDRARFVSTYEPEGAEDIEHVSTDLDGDGENEVVVAYVRSAGGVSHVDIAWWDGTDYVVEFRADGGAARRIDRVRIADVNRDGQVEIVTFQSGEGSSASATLWQVQGRAAVVGLPAAGGCHDGSITYGAVGVSFEDRDADGVDELYATCDDSPLPLADWTTDRYVWDAGAYRHVPSTIS